VRTYDPADSITYVHLGQRPTAPATAPHTRDECHRLPTGYANASPRARLGGRLVSDRPALAVLPGGSAAVADSAPAAPVLRLVR
jgi:hypothetical protein